MTKAVTAHRKKEHPELDTKTWRSLVAEQRCTEVKKGEKLKQAALKRHDAVRIRSSRHTWLGTWTSLRRILVQPDEGSTDSGGVPTLATS